jgi:hypothetical protein
MVAAAAAAAAAAAPTRTRAHTRTHNTAHTKRTHADGPGTDARGAGALWRTISEAVIHRVRRSPLVAGARNVCNPRRQSVGPVHPSSFSSRATLHDPPPCCLLPTHMCSHTGTYNFRGLGTPSSTPQSNTAASQKRRTPDMRRIRHSLHATILLQRLMRTAAACTSLMYPCGGIPRATTAR